MLEWLRSLWARPVDKTTQTYRTTADVAKADDADEYDTVTEFAFDQVQTFRVKRVRR